MFGNHIPWFYEHHRYKNVISPVSSDVFSVTSFLIRDPEIHFSRGQFAAAFV
jgi:hypothetical protein